MSNIDRRIAERINKKGDMLKMGGLIISGVVLVITKRHFDVGWVPVLIPWVSGGLLAFWWEWTDQAIEEFKEEHGIGTGT